MLYVPSLESNLLSAKQLTKTGNVAMFKEDSCITEKENDIFTVVTACNSLYELLHDKRADIVKFKLKIKGIKTAFI